MNLAPSPVLASDLGALVVYGVFTLQSYILFFLSWCSEFPVGLSVSVHKHKPWCSEITERWTALHQLEVALFALDTARITHNIVNVPCCVSAQLAMPS